MYSRASYWVCNSRWRTSTLHNYVDPQRSQTKWGWATALRAKQEVLVSVLLYTASDPQIIIDRLEQYYGRPRMHEHPRPPVILLYIHEDRAINELNKLPRHTSAAKDLNLFAQKLQNLVCVLLRCGKLFKNWARTLNQEWGYLTAPPYG